MAATKTPATGGRTPLMAGNWKMNLNHQEAVVLVQKLAWTLKDYDSWADLFTVLPFAAIGVGAAFALRTVTTSDPLTALGSNR